MPAKKKTTSMGKGYGEKVKNGRIQSKASVAYKSAISYGGKPEEIWEVAPVKASDALVKPRVKKSPKRMTAKKK